MRPRGIEEGVMLRTRSIASGIALAVAALAVAWSLAPAAAQAGSPITEFRVSPSTSQAGGHPDLDIYFQVENRMTQHIPPPTCDCQDPRDIEVHLPAGLIGDPHSTVQCNAVDFSNEQCPPDSQVGIVELGLAAEIQPNKKDEEEGYPGGLTGRIALYNLIPHPGQPALLGITAPALRFPIYTVLEPRTEGDYGLDAHVVQINHVFPLHTLHEVIWGVPAAPEHTELRHPPHCDPSAFGNPPCYPGVPSDQEEAPFLDNPTTCGEAQQAGLEVTAYDNEVTKATTGYPATSGCDQLSFNPSLFGQPTGTATDTASGLDIDLQVPQFENPKVPSPSEIRGATVTLPEGFAINPNAADGKVACSDLQAQLSNRGPAACPENAKVGTLSVTSAALPGPLPGYIYLGEPKPGDPYRLVLAASGFGVNVKIIGSVRANPATGQLVTVFDHLPQAPFSDFNMHFFGSERGLLVTPTQCGTYPVKSTFTPWDGLLAKQSSEQFFSLDRGPEGTACPGPVLGFNPGFEAGVTDKSAGQPAPFELRLTRSDGEQTLSGLTVKTPPGLSARLAGVAYCPDAALAAAELPTYSGLSELAAPICPASSLIGTAVTGAGAGTHPVYLPGKVYLAGPYKGAPLSLAVVTPAVSGPYDLGTVVVRAALHIDPTDAHITAVSNPLPRILEGIPLRIRSVLLMLDRPNFTVNPTDCEPFDIAADIAGGQGTLAARHARFQIANCAELPFSPKLRLRLKGGVTRAKNPAVRAVLTALPGEANIARTIVKLPYGEQIDQSHINNPCTRVQFAANQCPASSVIGTAVAESPLLEKPLAGNVYLRSSSHTLPDMVVALRGQVDIDLAARIDSVHQALRTSFETVPDVPVSKFRLNLFGGKRGLLINGYNLCKTRRKGRLTLVGQNNLVSSQPLAIHPSCGKARHARKSAHRHLKIQLGRRVG
jgi:hypothetical protein